MEGVGEEEGGGGGGGGVYVTCGGGGEGAVRAPGVSDGVRLQPI